MEKGTDPSVEVRPRRSPNAVVWVAILSVVLAWPAFVNGGVFPFYDTSSYIKGGAFAVEKLGSLFSSSDSSAIEVEQASTLPARAQSDGTAVMENASEPQVSGIRSATYSLFAFMSLSILQNGIVLALAQAVLIAYIAVLFVQKFAPNISNLSFLALVMVLALLTSAPWYASYAMPDIFTAVLPITVALFYFRLDVLSLFEKLALVAISAFAVTTHASNLPLLAGLIGLAALDRIVRDYRSSKSFSPQPHLWAIAPLFIAVAATVMVSVVGFGYVSVTPKRYPFVLARAIVDGPALWHLEEHCDDYNYAVCEVFDEIPTGINSFLWNEEGLVNAATPEQMERVRAEEMLIVRRAMVEYPLVYVKKASFNVIEQLSRVGLMEMQFGQYLGRTEDGGWQYVDADPRDLRATKRFEAAQLIVIFVSVIALAVLFLRFQRPSATELRLMLLFAAALLGNAIICGVLSGPADRYQGRIIWLIPLLAGVLIANYLSQRSQTAEIATVNKTTHNAA